MQRLAYLLTYPILWGISKLPYRVFYAVSDIAFFLVYYIVGYRKKVVEQNLTMAFPEKSKDEIHQIRKDFYHHFCDLFLEMTKSISFSEDEMVRRFVLQNPQELKRIESLQKSHIFMMGHYNSYEWVTALNLQGMKYKPYGIYKKIKNPYFDKMIRKTREKFGVEMLDKDEVIRQMIADKQNQKLCNYGMIADQAPKGGRSKYWRPFLGHRVPVFIGSEVAAKKLDLSVSYLKIEKVKRGYYQGEIISLTDKPKKLKDYQITDMYIEQLENQIKKDPQYYLWTHKRWKHMGQENKS
ncbi:MAG TPA: lysophospholipid acyltransferase family protein [Flavobacteriaceae bacterium]|nr:lysophospholipid acyltransferase family protein [Flavobacteriaceae bacterium]